MTPDERDPLHGWTLADIHAAAKLAVLMAGFGASDARERYEAAWDAITEAILTAQDPPSARELRYAAMKAVQRADREERRRHGIGRDEDSGQGFARYWLPGAHPSPEDGIVGRLALAQIWGELRPVHQSVLTALAAHGDRVSAAVACGRHVQTFSSHLHGARREFLRLWHEGEEPSRFWGSDDRRHGGQPATSALRARAAKRAKAVAAEAGRAA